MSDQCSGCGAHEEDDETVGQDSCEGCGGSLCETCARACEPKWCQGRSCVDPELACQKCGWEEEDCKCEGGFERRDY